MSRRQWMIGSGGFVALAALGIVVAMAAVREPEPGSRAAFARLSAASGAPAPAYSVPQQALRQHADSCQGYNLELEEAAGIQRRVGREAEAQRLLGMRRACAGGEAFVRSAQR